MKKANKVIHYMLMGLLIISVNLPIKCPVVFAIAADAKVLSMPVKAASYTPIVRTDPFEPFIKQEKILIEKLKNRRESTKIISASPLQRGSIHQFKLIGIIGDEKLKIAMLEDANKKFYPLFVGTIIGENKGKVTEILSDRIIIEEIIQIQKGKKRVNRVMIKLHRHE
jgi:Tfp pilus assembly protein PilP